MCIYVVHASVYIYVNVLYVCACMKSFRYAKVPEANRFLMCDMLVYMRVVLEDFDDVMISGYPFHARFKSQSAMVKEHAFIYHKANILPDPEALEQEGDAALDNVVRAASTRSHQREEHRGKEQEKEQERRKAADAVPESPA